MKLSILNIWELLEIELVFQNTNITHYLDNKSLVGLYIKTNYGVVTSS